MRVDELSVVVDLAREVGVALVGRLEYDLASQTSNTMRRSAYLGAVCELMRGQVDLAKGALSDEAAEGVVTDRLEVLLGELAALVSRDTEIGRGTYSSSSWYECASCEVSVLLILRPRTLTLALRPSTSALPFADCILRS